MHFFYGQLAWQPNAATTQEGVAQMMAALATYPWKEGGALPLIVQNGDGALAIQQAGEAGRSLSRPLHQNGLTIAADVRLDNRAELLTALGMHPAQGATLSDPELLLHAYRRWGIECPQHLLGDFAFALWDESQQRLLCARDFVGTRPFYYQQRPGQGFVCASDLRALLAHPDVPQRLNLAYVKAELLTGMGQFQHPAHTYYAGVEKLPPAHALTVDRSGLRTWAYWQPGRTPERRYANEADYVDEVRQLLHEAVACRVAEAAHGVGAHLSGGLDSSSMAVIAHRILQAEGRSVTGFSWAPPFSIVAPNDTPDKDDERPLVEDVAAAAGLPLRYTILTPEHALAFARRDHTRQPTTTLQLELSTSQDAAGLGIRTLLSGWGGDELLVFNGRGYFADLLRRGRWLTLQQEFVARGELHGSAVWKQWIASGLFPLLPTGLMRRLRQDDFPPPSGLPAILRPDFAAALADIEPLVRPELRERPGVRRMQIALLENGHLPYRMESWASHGATLGLTYAFPLLDQRIVEFALSIPDSLYFQKGWKRYLYRAAMDGILPDEVRWHKVKEDPAMAEQSRQVQKIAAPAVRDELRARATNPFVDVEKLIAAEEAVAGKVDAALSGGDRRAMRRALLARRAATGGGWLAYVDPAVDLW